jgi:hypothetical protein
MTEEVLKDDRKVFRDRQTDINCTLSIRKVYKKGTSNFLV